MLGESFNLLRSNIHNSIIIKNSHKNLRMYSTEKIKNNILEIIYKNQNFSSKGLSLEILLNKMKYFKMKKTILPKNVPNNVLLIINWRGVVSRGVEAMIYYHQQLSWIPIQSQPKIIFYHCQEL